MGVHRHYIHKGISFLTTFRGHLPIPITATANLPLKHHGALFLWHSYRFFFLRYSHITISDDTHKGLFHITQPVGPFPMMQTHTFFSWPTYGPFPMTITIPFPMIHLDTLFQSLFPMTHLEAIFVWHRQWLFFCGSHKTSCSSVAAHIPSKDTIIIRDNIWSDLCTPLLLYSLV